VGFGIQLQLADINLLVGKDPLSHVLGQLLVNGRKHKAHLGRMEPDLPGLHLGCSFQCGEIVQWGMPGQIIHHFTYYMRNQFLVMKWDRPVIAFRFQKRKFYAHIRKVVIKEALIYLPE
jgi:hypothetical protein